MQSGYVKLSDKEWRGEFQNTKKSGETFYEYALLSPVINNEGVAANFIANDTKENMAEFMKGEIDII